jgi:hypothetical protein
MFEFESVIVSMILPLSLFQLENRVCFSRGVYVTGAAWWAATRIMTRVGDHVQRTGDGCKSRVLNGRTIRRSGDTVCGMYRV